MSKDQTPAGAHDDWPLVRSLGPFREDFHGDPVTSFEFTGLGPRTVHLSWGDDHPQVIATLTAIDEARPAIISALEEYFALHVDELIKVGYHSAEHWIAYLTMINAVSYLGVGRAIISFGRGSWLVPQLLFSNGTFSLYEPPGRQSSLI